MKMRTTFCLLITLFILLISVTTSHAQESPIYIYWTDVQTFKIQRANLDGTNVQDIVTTDLIRPDGIALDLAGGKMYWTGAVWGASPPQDKIQRANLDGTNIEDLLINVGTREGITLDSVGGKMYWVNERHDKIQRANLDGTNIEDLVTTGLSEPTGITLDVIGGKMYWTDRDTGKIQRANLDGTNIEDLITTGLQAPINIALDLAGGKMYWTDWGTDKIQRANLDGTNIEDLITTELIGPDGIALHLAAGKMYWADWGTSNIRRANLDGTNVEVLVTRGLIGTAGLAIGIPQTPSLRFDPKVIADQTFAVNTPIEPLSLPVATDGTAPYTYTLAPLPTGLFFDAAIQELSGVPTTAGTTTVTYTATDATSASVSLTFTITVRDTLSPTDVYMYWTDTRTDKVQRANLDGTNIQDLVTVGLSHPSGIAVDVAGGKVYWTDTGTDKIQRANLDGTDIQDLVTGVRTPTEMDLDAAAGKMYWADSATNKIQRANLDGTNVEDVVTGLAGAWVPALDVSGGKIYWSDANTDKIQRANLDGTNVEDIVTGLIGIDGIAVDASSGKLYWADWEASKIQRSNLDGTNIEDIVIGVNRPSGIALDVSDGKIYWTNWPGNKIQRANLDGSNVEDIVTDIGHPWGIALGIPLASPGDGLRFSPDVIADQTFTVGTSVSLTLPTATGGTTPYTYSLAPPLPAGLYFDPIVNGPGYIGGTPTAAMPSTPFTYTATDTIGASASLTFTITVTEDGGLNLDVNGDGQVTVIDLAIVALFYGTRVPEGMSLPADVNADGTVNVLDLAAVAQGIDAAGGGNGLSMQELKAALVAGEIEGVAGAPMGFGRHQEVPSLRITYDNLAAALADAKHLSIGDEHLAKWLPVLEDLLHLLAEMTAIPETTALLPNYPNPFNPETWIPYHLAEAADVTLRIYSVDGKLVRRFALGHQPAGVYQSRSRAAYWDGKNEFDEPVASGLYFYTLTAGEFTATRKLLIRK